ncbi:hypothetical protein Tco_1038571 [Tanacetum coccineum]
MDNLNITMKEYIRLEEEKARRSGKVSVETEFPAIVFNEELTSEKSLSCEPTVSSLNDKEIDFRISFDESGDEDYTVIFDKNSFSYKIIYVGDLKTDSENGNKNVNVPSFPSPEPTGSYFDDLDFFKDFENEFPAIFYNDALTSKSDSSTEHVKIPHRIDESDLKNETSLSEYDEEEQNVVYFNDLLRFNIIYPDDLELDKDNDDNEINIIQSSEGYTNADITDFKERLGRIYGREIHRVHVFNFRGLTDLMAKGLSGRMLIEHRDAQGQTVFTSQAWRRLFEIRGSLVHKLILEFFSTFRFGDGVLDLDTPRALQFQLGGVRHRMSWREFTLGMGLHNVKEIGLVGFSAYWAESARQIPDKGDLSAYWVGISSVVDFLGTTPSYTSIRDPMLMLCHRLIACNIAGRRQAPKKVTVADLFYLRRVDVGSIYIYYMVARYLSLFASGRKRGAMISGGTGGDCRDLPVIDMAELGPQSPPAQTMAQRLARVEEEVHEIRGSLGEQHEVMDVMARDLSRFIVWAAGGISQLLDFAGATYVWYSETHVPYQRRRVRQRTRDASTSAAPHDEDQPDH